MSTSLKLTRTYLIFVPVFVLLAAVGWQQRERIFARQCPAFTDSLRSRLIQEVRIKYAISSEALVDIEAGSPLAGTCMRRISVHTSTWSKSMSFVLSEKQRYLFRDAIDLLDSKPIDRPRAQSSNVKVDMGDLQTNDPPEFGPGNAPVTLVVFSDFQCPFCARFAKTIEAIRSSGKHDVKIVFHEFPLSIHPNAKKEAALAVCTADQSTSAFWDLHDYLFTHQRPADNEDPSKAGLEFLSTRHDVNVHRLSTCMESSETDAKIERDIQLGNKYGVSGTPTSFLNGQRVNGAQDASSLNSMIDKWTKSVTPVNN